MKTLVLPLVSASWLAMAAPAIAQHAGHAHHAPPAKASAAPAPKKPASTPAPARKPAPQTVAPASTTATDHAQMDHSHLDHAAMGHGSAPVEATESSAEDHAAMGHGAGPVKASSDHDAMGHSGMDHAAMSPEDHAAMGHGTVGSLPADAAPRTPIPVPTDADRAAAFPEGLHAHAAHDRGVNSYWLADRLEWQDTDDGSLAWEGVAWIGGDVDRLWLRTEGEASDGEIGHGDVEVLYGRGVSAWWDVVAGIRQDIGHGPSRTWAAFGVQGLASYKFEVEATAYVGSGGRTAATFEAEYDTLLTNRLILQWQAEAGVHGRDDPAAGIGAGLSTVEAGARLRYEITRRFAPYIGVQAERAFGHTADLRRADGEPTRDTRLVAGVRFWF